MAAPNDKCSEIDANVVDCMPADDFDDDWDAPAATNKTADAMVVPDGCKSNPGRLCVGPSNPVETKTVHGRKSNPKYVHIEWETAVEPKLKTCMAKRCQEKRQ